MSENGSHRTILIGVATPRVEGEHKVTGRALYAVHMTLPGILWGQSSASGTNRRRRGHGMGYALMEHLMIEDGKVVTANFGDYKIPSIKDIPDLLTSVVERPKGPGPYNSMSIGEMVNIPVAAAVANAVEDAVGVRIKSLPITAEKVLEAIRANGRSRTQKPKARGTNNGR
jgi:CO/xanthine dehydrogenase Mo-binding subunit